MWSHYTLINYLKKEEDKKEEENGDKEKEEEVEDKEEEEQYNNRTVIEKFPTCSGIPAGIPPESSNHHTDSGIGHVICSSN